MPDDSFNAAALVSIYPLGGVAMFSCAFSAFTWLTNCALAWHSASSDADGARKPKKPKTKNMAIVAALFAS